MNNNNFHDYTGSSDSCTSRGACSISPSIAALQELLLYLIKQISYYILELDKFNLNNEKLIKDVINSLSSLILINELNEKQLYSLIVQNYYTLNNAKTTYENICSKRNISCNFIENKINFDEKTPLYSAINIGENIQKSNYSKKNIIIRNYEQILLLLVKSVCSNISRLYDYSVCNKLSIISVFRVLNLLNNEKLELHQLQESTNLLAKKDFELNLMLSDELQKNFGKVAETKLSHSSRHGKAILVSGNNFFDLLNVLELTKDKNIDVYTHSGLLIAHALEKFKTYKHLIAHYGDTNTDCIVDFGTFPGAILLTNNSQNNTEFLYRGRIFSNDYNIPQGVIKIENSDYSPLVNSALSSKGFTKGKQKPDTKLGFNDEKFFVFMDKIMERLVKSEIRHLYVVIGNTISALQSEYFRIFQNNIKDNEFMLSFSYGENSKNALVLNLGDYYPLIIDLVYKIFHNRLDNNKITFIFNTCNIRIISGIIMLKNSNVKNIYISHCSPRLVNPSVFDTFIQKYNLKLTSNPIDDLKSMTE